MYLLINNNDCNFLEYQIDWRICTGQTFKLKRKKAMCSSGDYHRRSNCFSPTMKSLPQALYPRFHHSFQGWCQHKEKNGGSSGWTGQPLANLAHCFVRKSRVVRRQVGSVRQWLSRFGNTESCSRNQSSLFRHIKPMSTTCPRRGVSQFLSNPQIPSLLLGCHLWNDKSQSQLVGVLLLPKRQNS